MRRSTFLLGVGVGFVLGSRAGRGPYDQVESKAREIAGRPDVQDRIKQFAGTAKGKAATVVQKVTPWQGPAEGRNVAPPDPSPQSYADPQDLQFSTAAAGKEELVDTLLAEGVPPAEMERKEDQLRQAGVLSEPPPANKAEPVNDT